VKQSLKARGVQFPGRDAESLVPIFTPPRAFPSEPDLSSSVIPEPPVIAQYTPEQAKEVLDVAKNAVELLSTVLTSSPQQEVLKVSPFSLFYAIQSIYHAYTQNGHVCESTSIWH
jgi:hypothetical protein